MKKTRTKHSPEFKAKVALAAVQEQETVAAIARLWVATRIRGNRPRTGPRGQAGLPFGPDATMETERAQVTA